VSVADTLRELLRTPDRRTAREVDDEIEAELEFHLAEAARELELDGLAPAEARYTIGYRGLRSLDGVSYDESQGAAWWRERWTQNQARFGR
jgi:hypothetical protein